MFLPESTFGEVRTVRFAAALLPWGAIEPHNYHLPYLTDVILAESLAIDASRLAKERYGINTMVLPGVPCGSQNPGQHDLPFCIHFRYETQRDILRDIVAALYRQGIRTLLIINGHGGNSFKPLIRDLALDFPTFRIALSNWFEVLPLSDYFENPGDHADEMETSLLMHYRPSLVDLSTAGSGEATGWESEPMRRKVAWIPRNWSRTTVDTGVGDPSLATVEKGARYAADCASAYADLLHALAEGKP